MLCIQKGVRSTNINLAKSNFDFVMMLVSPPHRIYHLLTKSELGSNHIIQFLLSSISKNVIILANRADPDETLRFAASHLGLRCLYMFPF